MVESLGMRGPLPVQSKAKISAIPRSKVIEKLTYMYEGDKTLAKRSYLRALFRTLALQNLSVLSSDGNVLNLELKDNGKGKLICVALPQSERPNTSMKSNPSILNAVPDVKITQLTRVDCKNPTTGPQKKRARGVSFASMSPMMGLKSKRVQMRPVNSPREHLKFEEKSRKRTSSSPIKTSEASSKRAKVTEKQCVMLNVLASICTTTKA